MGQDNIDCGRQMQSGDLVPEVLHRIAQLREAHRTQLFDERGASLGIGEEDGAAVELFSTIRAASIAAVSGVSGLVRDEPSALRATSRKKPASATRARRSRPFA